MKLATRNWRLAAITMIALFSVACGLSIPNLEDQQCSTARDSAREFYSWYLGTDSESRAKQKEFYDRYVSPGFTSTASGDVDPFFLSDTTPKTLKVGKCEERDDSHVAMQVQLYWKQEGHTDQKEVYADMSMTGGKWLIDKVESR
jgi:hypothetical protein